MLAEHLRYGFLINRQAEVRHLDKEMGEAIVQDWDKMAQIKI